MDNLFSNFKSATDEKGEAIYERKMFERAKVLEQRKTTPDIQVPVAHLNNDDIPEIVNRKPDDPMDRKPFDSHFTSTHLSKS